MILVVGVKLGLINHAMLTAQAIQHAGLTLAVGWRTMLRLRGKRHAEYMTTLTRMIPAPLLGEIPWLAENPENAATEST
ncbi:dithiobiotin synthetase [Escherichia coli]|uniref:Dithiobiotin synthetase n=1 Tax=Escherichia coli TaxID=562 RepID=A0A377E6H6_ECOLX|nr:dithiobiotin synthetase [Escherichia coli]